MTYGLDQFGFVGPRRFGSDRLKRWARRALQAQKGAKQPKQHPSAFRNQKPKTVVLCVVLFRYVFARYSFGS